MIASLRVCMDVEAGGELYKYLSSEIYACGLSCCPTFFALLLCVSSQGMGLGELIYTI